MVSSTHQASNQTPVISSNSMEISENAETVAVSTEEMSANVREISRGTEHVAQISKTAVDQATTAMNSISELDARSQEIGDIIKVITAISQQTNLLALNATIEAARAGDFGRGFAVVAHEIKELSRETAVSGESIIRKLETIRTGSSHAAEGIQAISKIIHEIHDISNAIASGIEEQAITTEDIAKRMAYVAKGSRDITVAMNDVTSIVQITTDNASRVQETGNTLFALADTLQRLVDQFKIWSDTAVHRPDVSLWALVSARKDSQQISLAAADLQLVQRFVHFRARGTATGFAAFRCQVKGVFGFQEIAHLSLNLIRVFAAF